MSIGYACLTLGVPDTVIKRCLMKNADEKRLHALICDNIAALERMIDYNIKNGIQLFRISSDIIPFASSAINTIPWWHVFGEHLGSIGQKVREGGMRVSMHPGQYTVLNSPSSRTIENAVRELEYHALFLDSLSVDDTNKIILHVGGAYGEKHIAMQRFLSQYQCLSERVKARLVIENDDTVYNIQDVLEIGLKSHIPVVFDHLHHQINPGNDSALEAAWIMECAKSWSKADGRQKIHYSQPDKGKKPGAHALSIGVDEFLGFYECLGESKPDIMLEVKDKNISAIKCLLCTKEKGEIGALEREWGRYKYLVLERSQEIYQSIRQLLKNKEAYPALAFYRRIEAALALPMKAGNALNAAAHVWGYIKDAATLRQKADIKKMMESYSKGKVPLASLKRRLYTLADLYHQTYLLESYYFVLQYGGSVEHDNSI